MNDSNVMRTLWMSGYIHFLSFTGRKYLCRMGVDLTKGDTWYVFIYIYVFLNGKETFSLFF